MPAHGMIGCQVNDLQGKQQLQLHLMQQENTC